MTKNIQISFRLTEYQLAHGLEIIRGLEKSYQPQSLSAMVKMIYQDWLAKLSAATSPWPRDCTVREIKQIMANTAAGRQASIKRSNDEQTLAKIMKSTNVGHVHTGKPAGSTMERSMETPINRQKLAQSLTDIQAKCLASQKTGSVKSVVTDFSPLTFDELTEKNNK